MRLLPAFFLVTTLSAAQAGAPFSSQANALGGRYGAVGMGRPLGGITPAAPRQGARRTAGLPVYGYSWYVPGYLDSSSSYAPEPAPAFAPPPPQPPPVIINQYFTAPPPQPQEPQHTAGEPLAPVENYYLIAYKDHSVYPVISYWLEDKTLHYVTTQNTHNQASLDLIDLDLTKTLNRVRDVPFSLPGR